MLDSFAFGRNSYFCENTHIAQFTTIGDFCSIANLCTIGARPHDMGNLTTRVIGDDPKVVTEIGHDVWIGCNSVILAGVKVGIGAVIGAGSVVTKDVPPYAIVVGNPARVLKYRFSPELIDKLLKSKWWELTDEEIKSLPLNDPEKCVEILSGAGNANG